VNVYVQQEVADITGGLLIGFTGSTFISLLFKVCTRIFEQIVALVSFLVDGWLPWSPPTTADPQASRPVGGDGLTDRTCCWASPGHLPTCRPVCGICPPDAEQALAHPRPVFCITQLKGAEPKSSS